MESFFLFVIKELAKQIGPVGGLLVALVLFLYFYERKSRESLADKLYDLSLKQTVAMTEFNKTFEALDRELDHGFDHMNEHLTGIKHELERIQQPKDW
jgi:hypothetical protein